MKAAKNDCENDKDEQDSSYLLEADSIPVLKH